MPYKMTDLPKYPVTEDVWDVLKREKRPITVYGMGNGADKLFARFEQYGITVADVFASDGFVRGHTYRGYRVKSFSEIKQTYSDFVIVLSFASNRAEVIEMLADIDANHTMYVPDMPISETEEYFDKEFYNKNYSAIMSAYNALADEESRAIYSSVINYRLSGKLSYLIQTYTGKSELYELLNRVNVEVMIDAGAYNGDTAKEAIEFFPNIKKIHAIEPDRRNFKKLSLYAETANIEIVTYNAAVWSDCREGIFSDSGNRNSTASATASYKHKETEISFISVDFLAEEKTDFIKYDVEGAEYEALLGSAQTIEKNKPMLLVSLYHKSKDIFYLTNMLAEKYGDCEFYMRRLYCIPSWEIDLVMIPKKANKEIKNEKT